MFQIILTNILLIGFLLTEMLLRKKGEAKSFETDESDKGSTGIIGFSFIFSIFLLISLSIARLGFFYSIITGCVGLFLMAIGLLLRIWSMIALGNYYSRTLRVVENQKVIDNGPYSVIRHPGYLSSILIWVGTGLAVENWILITIFTCMFFVVYIYRITAEEKMLVLEFGEQYINYKKKTWRLIPFLF
jgi:protein-S-isoprenylcysteine O-methyltransferase Ste14